VRGEAISLNVLADVTLTGTMKVKDLLGRDWMVMDAMAGQCQVWAENECQRPKWRILGHGMGANSSTPLVLLCVFFSLFLCFSYVWITLPSCENLRGITAK
jgi:hypothetical protein